MTNNALLRVASAASLLAAAALVVMLLIAIAHGGVTQQHFEVVSEAPRYAEALAASRQAMMLTIAVDNIFVILYVTALTSAAWAFRGASGFVPAGIAVIGAVALGLLDWHENLDFLRMYALLDSGGAVTLFEIGTRMHLSLMKWHIAYGSLFLLGCLVPWQGVVAALLKLSLWALLPLLGAAFIVLPEAFHPWVSIMRYGAMLLGFFMMAAVFRTAARAAQDG